MTVILLFGALILTILGTAIAWRVIRALEKLADATDRLAQDHQKRLQ